MNRRAKGKLIIIGGHEDKDGDRVILEEVCQDARDGGGSLVVVTVASSIPEEMGEMYLKLFKEMGVPKVEMLDVRERDEAKDEKFIEVLKDASVIFFTGGDQLRITSQIGESLIYQQMMRLIQEGCTIAGTSAGAAAMPETMIIGGPSDQSNKVDSLSMAPGLGLIGGVVIDSHFAERGRIGRLLGAVAQNPKNLGIGIDEDTALVFEGGKRFRVVGSGAVYVADGTEISFSSLSEEKSQGVLSIYDVKLHVLAQGDRFDLVEKRPIAPKNPQERE